MTPIQILYSFLQEQGLFDEWTDSEGVVHPAVTVQTRFLEESKIGNNMCLFIKTSGSGGGTRYVSTPTMLFAVLGKVGQSAVIAEEFAEKVYSALLNFESDGCLISIDPMGGVNGAYGMDSGRRAYDMEFSTKVDSGHLGSGSV